MFSLSVAFKMKGVWGTYATVPILSTRVLDEPAGISSMIPLMRLDFPLPTGPQTATTSPFRTEKSNRDTVNDEESLSLPSVPRPSSDDVDCDPIMNEARRNVKGGTASAGKTPSDAPMLSCTPRVSLKRKVLIRLIADSA